MEVPTQKHPEEMLQSKEITQKSIFDFGGHVFWQRLSPSTSLPKERLFLLLQLL